MEDAQWSALADYFKEKFPACSKCQEGCRENPDIMLVHLTVSHFEQKAIAIFGQGQFCSYCGEKLPQCDESFKNYNVLSHMAKHFDLIVPKEAKHLLEVPTEAIGCSTTSSESKSPDGTEDESKAIWVSESVFEELGGSNNEKIDDAKLGTRSSSDHSSDLEDEPKTENKCPISKDITLNSTQNHKSLNVSFQVCQEYFRNKYPTCESCTRGHEWITNMKRHLVFQHCGKQAMELFGSGNTCAICKKFSTRHSHYKYRSTSIKCHMKAHLALCFPDERGKELLKLLGNRNVSSCKFSTMWQDLQEYFKNKYPSCETCKIGHKRLVDLKRHLVIMHYPKLAIKCFGKSITCSICKNFSIKPTSSSSIIQMKKHMSCHIQDFIPDEEAKAYLNNIISATRKPPEQKPAKKKAPYQDCEDYFRSKYPSCQTCKSGHVNFQKLKRHMTVKHCDDRALKMFGTGSSCTVCHNFSVKVSQSGEWTNNLQIKCHMAIHLELFIADDKAKDLLLKAKLCPQKS